MRILLKLIIFIIVVVIAALIAIPLLVDPNDYKQQISDKVEQTTGRNLTLEGDIGLSVFPWVALELGPLSLSNAKGFDEPHFAKVNEAEIRIKLMPLLKNQLEMDTIVLDGLVLNLEKAKNGTTNWDDLSQSSDSEKTADKSKGKSSSTERPPLAAISIAGVRLSNAHIVWTDHSKDEKVQIKNLNLQTDPLIAGKATALAVGFDIESNKPQTQANVNLASDIMVNIDKEQLILSNLNLQTLAEGAGLPLPKVDFILTGDINADMKNQTADLSKLVIQIQDILIYSNLQVSQLSSENPSFTGDIDVKAFNLRQLAEQLSIELPAMADSNTLELIQLSSQLEGSSKHINVNQLNLTLDQSKLSGNLGIKQFSNPAISFRLALDEIDADRYLPPTSTPKKPDTSTKAAPPATASAAAASELPLETLRQLNLNGSLDIGKLKMSGTHSDQVHIEINANDGVIKLHPMTANLYQGQYQGNVGLDARSKKLKVSINENLQNLQAGPLLKDLSGDDKISGLVNAKVNLSGSGVNVEKIKQSLSGNGEFSFTDGSLKGVNIAESIRKAKAALKGEVLPANNEPVKTDFSSLAGSFKASNGVINNQDLALMSPLLRINGAGTADIVKEVIDYGLKVSIVETSTGQAGKDLADLKGVTIPVKITGSFNDPKPSVDLASIAKEKATAEIKEKLNEKINEKLGDKLDGELGGLLGGVLGGSTNNEANDAETKNDEQVTEPATTPEDQVKDAIENKLKSFF